MDTLINFTGPQTKGMVGGRNALGGSNWRHVLSGLRPMDPEREEKMWRELHEAREKAKGAS